MNKILLVVSIALLSASVSGCATRAVVGYNDGPRYYDGPPPHAPAHGYRHKYHQHDMVYDSNVAAYVVVGYSDYFFIDDLYFRFRDGNWQFSASMRDNDWHHADYNNVPYKLRNSKADKYREKERYNDKKRDKGYDKDKGKGNDRDRGNDRDKGKGHGNEDHNGNGNGKKWDDD